MLKENIILRTVCGCERILDVPGHPREWLVPFIRKRNQHVVFLDRSFDGPDVTTRKFERTSLRGKYGYMVYLEVLES